MVQAFCPSRQICLKTFHLKSLRLLDGGFLCSLCPLSIICMKFMASVVGCLGAVAQGVRGIRGLKGDATDSKQVTITLGQFTRCAHVSGV